MERVGRCREDSRLGQARREVAHRPHDVHDLEALDKERSAPAVRPAISKTEEAKSDKIRALSEKLFLSYPVRRLEAEVLSDSIGVLTGNFGRYTSVIPEPFTFLPPGTRAVQIADGSISSVRLDLFGRPSRDSGKISDRNNQITGAQRLYLLNSNTIYWQVTNLGKQIGRRCKWQLERRGIGEIYLRILSRNPTPLEKKWIMDYQRKLPKNRSGQVWPDLFWVLVNSKEFLYYH